MIINDNQPIQMLELILGPMFSGKTTYLCHRAEAASYIGNVLYVIHSLETRSSSTNSIYSHNKSLKLDSPQYRIVYVSSLKELTDEFIQPFSTVCIDEAQFFDELYDDVVRITSVLKKDVHVAGLSGTSERLPFKNGELLKLACLATDITLLKTAYCQRCANENKKVIANFTHCLNGNKEGEILIGGESLYIPVCGECWDRFHLKTLE
jgi:thymidine kinase